MKADDRHNSLLLFIGMLITDELLNLKGSGDPVDLLLLSQKNNQIFDSYAKS